MTVKLSLFLAFLFISNFSFGQTAPILSCPTMQNLPLPAGGGTVTFTDANIPALLGVSATDPDLANATITYSTDIPSVDCSNIGVVMITVTATDDVDGLSSNCLIPVTVMDNGPSAIALPTVTVMLDAAGNYTLTTTDVDNGSSQCVGMPMLSLIGTTSYTCADVGNTFIVTLSATDGTLTQTDMSTITVADNTAPTVNGTPQADINQNNDAGLCTAIVTYVEPTFNDNCGGMAQPGMRTAGPASGSAFPVGTTIVTHSFTDAGNTTITSSFIVVITDTEAPTVSAGAQGNIAMGTNSPTLCGAVVTYTVPTFDDNCGGMAQLGTQTSGLASGTTFPLGTTTVTHSFTSNGMIITHSFDVIVTDDDAPTVQTPTTPITVNNDAGMCSAVVTYTPPVFMDNCDGMGLAGTLTAGLASGTTFPVGVTTVTYSYTDAALNGPITSSFTVTVNDNEAPDAAAVNPGNLVVNNDTGVCQATVSWPTVSAADNCPVLITTNYTAIDARGNTVSIFTAVQGGVPVDFGDFPIGLTNVTYTVTDPTGNSSMGTFTVTVNDNEMPSITCPPTQTLHFANCNSANEVVPDYRALTSVTDNCTSGILLSQSPTPGTLLSAVSTPAGAETFSVTITATDGSALGLSANCTFTVELIEDNALTLINPVAVLPPVTSTCGLVIVDAPTAFDECGNFYCGVPFPSATQVGGSCNPSGVVNTTTHSSGAINIPLNSTTPTNFHEITVAGIDPVITDVNISIDIQHIFIGDVSGTLTSPEGTTINFFSQPGLNTFFFGCPGDDIEVTFDDAAAASYSSFDNTCNLAVPSISGTFQSQFNLLTVLNGENPNGNWRLTVTDNFAAFDDGAIEGWSLEISASGPTSVPQYSFAPGSYPVTWTFDDGNGNTATQNQQITSASDNIPPTLTCNDITVSIDAAGQATVSGGSLLGESFTLGGINSNQAEYCYTATSAATLTFDWENTQEAQWDPFGFSIDNNAVQLTIASALGGAASQSGTETIEVAAGETFCFFQSNDGSVASSTTVSFTPGFVGDLAIGNWTPSAAGATFNAAAITDNCGVSNPTILIDGNLVGSFGCADIGVNTVTVSATDINGNIGTCTSTVTVVDNAAPVFNMATIPADTTVTCASIPTPPALSSIVATDNCGNVGVIFNETSFQSGNTTLCSNYIYNIERTWTATDINGNAFTATQIITVADSDVPVVDASFPTVMTISTSQAGCGASVPLVLTANEVSDSCASFADLTISHTINNGSIINSADASNTYPPGTYIIRFSISDPCGLTAMHTTTLVVVDDVDPIASCKSNVNLVIPAGQDSIIIPPSLIDNGSFDNCGNIVNMTVSPNVFYCSQADGVTPYNVTLTVFDDNGGSAQCLTSIIIQDNTAPTVVCQDITVALDAGGNATITAADITGSITDCSGVADVQISQSSFNTTHIGNNPVSLIVEDVNGNLGACVANVFIEVAKPCFDIPDNFQVGSGLNCIPVTVSDFTNVRSFQHSIYIDPAVAEFVGICSHNLPAQPLVNVDNDTLTISYFSTSTSLLNGDVVYEIQVNVIGALSTTSLLTIGDDPTPQEVIVEYGGNLYTQTSPWCATQNGSIEVTNASLSATGNIRTWDLITVDTVIDNTQTPPDTTITVNTFMTSQPVNNVSVLKKENGLPAGGALGGTTDINGNYTISASNLAGGILLELDATKNVNWLNYEPFPIPATGATFQGVSSFDLFKIQQHIVNNELFTSNYQLIAADANDDDWITTLDLVLLQDIIVGNSTSISTNESWRFVPAADSLHNQPLPSLPFSATYSQPITVSPFAGNTNSLDWIAVKIGNVVGPVVSHFLTAPTTASDTRTGDAFTMNLENNSYKTGEFVEIPFLAKDFNNFAAWQFTLEFDGLAYESMIPGSLTNFTEGNLGINYIETGKLAAVWYATEVGTISDDEVLFTLRFEVLDDVNRLSEVLAISNGLLKSEAYQSDGTSGDISLNYFTPTVVTTPSTFELYQNTPNPFSDKTQISFTLPESGFAKLTLFDLSGRTLKVIEGDYDKGLQQVEILSSDLPTTGVIYYQLESANDTATKKMILID